MIYHFSLEGNIGAGKTTLINQLRNELHTIDGIPVIYLDEPVDLWQSIRDNITGDNILEKFYQDQKRYAFQFQVLVLTTLSDQLRKIKETHSDCIVITERSMKCSLYVFAQLLFDDTKLTKIEYEILDLLFSELNMNHELCGILYLPTDPGECHRRIIKRNRPGEDIDLHYLNSLDMYYDKWLVDEDVFCIKDDLNDMVEYIKYRIE